MTPRQTGSIVLACVALASAAACFDTRDEQPPVPAPLAVEPKALVGSVEVHAYQGPANVFVDGVARGTTMLVLDGLPVGTTMLVLHDLPFGPHKLRFERSGYFPVEQSVAVYPNNRNYWATGRMMHDQSQPMPMIDPADQRPVDPPWLQNGKAPRDLLITSKFVSSSGDRVEASASRDFLSWRHGRHPARFSCKRALRTTELAEALRWAELEQAFLGRVGRSSETITGAFPNYDPPVKSTLTAHGYVASWEEIDRLHLAHEIRDRLASLVDSELAELQVAAGGASAAMYEGLEPGQQMRARFQVPRETTRIANLEMSISTGGMGWHRIEPLSDAKRARVEQALRDVVISKPGWCEAEVEVTVYVPTRHELRGIVE